MYRLNRYPLLLRSAQSVHYVGMDAPARTTKPKRPDLVAFGTALALARRRAGLSQGRLGELVGEWKQGSVSDWERGNTECPPPVVMAIEEVLGLEPGDLSHHLGYLPLSAAGRTIEWDVIAAIVHDAHLTEVQRQALTLAYEAYRTQ